MPTKKLPTPLLFACATILGLLAGIAADDSCPGISVALAVPAVVLLIGAIGNWSES